MVSLLWRGTTKKSRSARIIKKSPSNKAADKKTPAPKSSASKVSSSKTSSSKTSASKTKAAVAGAALAAGATSAAKRNQGIESFKGDDGEHYFAYFENGKIALISEGYPTAAARDNGAASVEKNISLEDRYQYRGPLRNGKYDFKLKAGNNKEIARSVWYSSVRLLHRHQHPQNRSKLTQMRPIMKKMAAVFGGG